MCSKSLSASQSLQLCLDCSNVPRCLGTKRTWHQQSTPFYTDYEKIKNLWPEQHAGQVTCFVWNFVHQNPKGCQKNIKTNNGWEWLQKNMCVNYYHFAVKHCGLAGRERAWAFYSLVLSPAPPLLVSVTPPIQVFDRLLAVNASQYHSSIHLACTRMLTFNIHFFQTQTK